MLWFITTELITEAHVIRVHAHVRACMCACACQQLSCCNFGLLLVWTYKLTDCAIIMSNIFNMYIQTVSKCCHLIWRRITSILICQMQHPLLISFVHCVMVEATVSPSTHTTTTTKELKYRSKFMHVDVEQYLTGTKACLFTLSALLSSLSMTCAIFGLACNSIWWRLLSAGHTYMEILCTSGFTGHPHLLSSSSISHHHHHHHHHLNLFLPRWDWLCSKAPGKSWQCWRPAIDLTPTLL